MEKPAATSPCIKRNNVCPPSPSLWRINPPSPKKQSYECRNSGKSAIYNNEISLQLYEEADGSTRASLYNIRIREDIQPRKKPSVVKTFVVADAAMNDLLRPALYGAVHPITRISCTGDVKKASGDRVDIVGPVCETGDCLLHDWPLGEVKPGDVLAIWVAGAYGMTQASNYNARTRPAEVLIDGTHNKLIRRRETQDDLLRTDVLAPGRGLRG